jgi:hypothetical protein
MRIFAPLLLVALACSTALSGQDSSATQAIGDGSPPPQQRDPSASTKLVTLVGCVTIDETTPGQYTIVESKGGAKYRLSGTDMHTYVGHEVQVTGGPKKLAVGFGLLPSPNAAAQAGAVDPPPAAAATPAATSAPLPEFRVKSVKTVSGSCPQ